MGRSVEGANRNQATLLPECLEDFIAEDNPVRIVDAFVDELQLASLGFNGATPAITGRPSYHPAVLLKIYIYGYLNRVQSSRRLERECQRNVELMWLTGRLAPDFKTIAELSRIEWTWDLPEKFATARNRVSSLDESGAIPETNHWKRADHRLAPTPRSVRIMAILMIDFKASKLRHGIHDSDWTRNRSCAGRC